MKSENDCLPCFLGQALAAARLVTNDEKVQQRVLRRSLSFLAETDLSASPPEIASELHRFIREETSNDDPYLAIKRELNSFALGLLPALKEKVSAAADPFDAAVRLAIAANIMDSGVHHALTTEQVLEGLAAAASQPLAIDHIAKLKAAVNQAESILYLADNAGEIVLDTLLLERIPCPVTLVVRGGPTINDALLEDAQAAGVDALATVIDSGIAMPGTVVYRSSKQLQDLFEQADLVISKGMGNFETLSHEDREIYHLLKAKCPTVAGHLGCKVGDLVVARRINGAPA